MENFINDYLRQRLIDVGDNEGRLDSLQAAATSLVADFAANPDLLVRFVRTTLVPSVDADTSAMEGIAEKVEASWATFAGLTPERRVPMVIAVGWQAVLEFTQQDHRHLALVWYASANAIARGTIDDCVQPVIGYVQSLGAEVEAQARAEWRSHVDKVTKQVKSITVPEAKTHLSHGLLAASSGAAADGSTIENGNSHPIDATGAWAQLFSKKASQAILSAINKRQKAAIDAVQDSFSDLSKKFNTIRDEAIRSHRAQNRRTELLWLAESQYSPRFGCGYANLKGRESVAALAFDIAEIASGISPLSVEHFLAVQATNFSTSGEGSLARDNAPQVTLASPLTETTVQSFSFSLEVMNMADGSNLTIVPSLREPSARIWKLKINDA